MDVIERIKEQLKSNPVVLYMKGTPDFPQCGFSAAAVRALAVVRRELRVREHLRGSGAARGAQAVFELADVPAALRQAANWSAAPTSSPRCTRTGELQQLLQEAGAVDASDAALTLSVVPASPVGRRGRFGAGIGSMLARLQPVRGVFVQRCGSGCR